ncbi:membrane protein [Sphingomonas paucimobilis]|uniref:Porin family protein n=2 Tax=Sphingomonas paucimobilis TaxID=13689 RepID=A0A411LLB3_SPHPI|nr:MULTISPECIES: porin family protein [Sphingomonas]MBQ1481848.1 porin family protein [Sphingomonas sp.]MCM3680138.1 outer membrane beta-barrel protein [Sphingomonas paucimobilis]MDG5970328.1 outer membrane beta-barrel protein [Sphingomonas paucimobilis]NNG56286.1 porin family protein [Sphingomonas paucimobilis]QBE93125.1 porin family protein [Sphingomonas paucimobilis]
MRKLMLAALATSAALAAAAPAAAQTTTGQPFTGFRVEGLIGYDSLNDRQGKDNSSSDGVLYGAGIGYDIPAGPVILGAEGEITGSSSDTRSNNVTVPGDQFRLGAGRDLYAGARVGYMISPVALGYVKAGYTNAKFDARYTNAGVTNVNSQEVGGYRLGAGLEYAISPNTFVKGEYRYSHYDELDGVGINPNRHQLLAGLGLRF